MHRGTVLQGGPDALGMRSGAGSRHRSFPVLLFFLRKA